MDEIKLKTFFDLKRFIRNNLDEQYLKTRYGDNISLIKLDDKYFINYIYPGNSVSIIIEPSYTIFECFIYSKNTMDQAHKLCSLDRENPIAILNKLSCLSLFLVEVYPTINMLELNKEFMELFYEYYITFNKQSDETR